MKATHFIEVCKNPDEIYNSGPHSIVALSTCLDITKKLGWATLAIFKIKLKTKQFS